MANSYSAGIFWDQDNSLLASIIFNGTDNYLLRLNSYPGVLSFFKQKPWWYVGVGQNFQFLDIGVGLDFFPLGLGAAF